MLTTALVAVAGISFAFKARNPELKIYSTAEIDGPCTVEVLDRTTEPNANPPVAYEFASTTTTTTCGPLTAWPAE
ncbi:hypothetical protein [Pedobacter paludis]|nr:hypothetical protein [Pedobacter paludis]